MAKQKITTNQVVFSGCKVYRTTAQTITPNGYNQMQWDAEVYDTDNYHSLVSNITYLTVPTTGYYRVSWHTSWPNGSGIVDTWVCVNGVPASRYAGLAFTNTATGNTVEASSSCTLYLTAGNYVELWPFQSSAGNLSIQGGSDYSTYLQIEKIGV